MNVVSLQNGACLWALLFQLNSFRDHFRSSLSVVLLPAQSICFLHQRHIRNQRYWIDWFKENVENKKYEKVSGRAISSHWFESWVLCPGFLPFSLCAQRQVPSLVFLAQCLDLKKPRPVSETESLTWFEQLGLGVTSIRSAAQFCCFCMHLLSLFVLNCPAIR